MTMRPGRIATITALVGLAGLGLWVAFAPQPVPVDLAAIARGTLEVTVGDRIEINNRDEVPHQVGPYTVAAGQSLQ
ncbi:MAG: hypothetical protein ACOCYE_07330, partial [Pseudomonadota bacterium]